MLLRAWFAHTFGDICGNLCKKCYKLHLICMASHCHIVHVLTEYNYLSSCKYKLDCQHILINIMLTQNETNMWEPMHVTLIYLLLGMIVIQCMSVLPLMHVNMFDLPGCTCIYRYIYLSAAHASYSMFSVMYLTSITLC